MPLVGNHYLGEAQIESLRKRVTWTICNVWRVERTDGVVQRFASHDKTVRFQREDYVPLGPSASDIEQGEAAAESDFEMIGFLSADTIKAAAIRAGRYDGARIVHHVIDWARPWTWTKRHVWYIKNIQEGGTVFRASVQGVERHLTFQAGRFYERECEKTLGSLECGATPIETFSAAVEAVASVGSEILGVPHDRAAMRITAASWTPPRDGLMSMGKVTWTSGPNSGTSQLIGGHVGRELLLEERAPFPIKVGDVCTLFSGCDGTKQTCIVDYDNGINHGGISEMPTTEDTYRRPNER